MDGGALWWIILTAISAAFLVRVLLILMGILKSPVLRQLRRYGESQPNFHLMSYLFLWSGLVALWVGLLIMEIARSNYPAFLPSCASFAFAYLAARSASWLTAHGLALTPRWVRRLNRYTARDDQRRVAYMWLLLPPGLRWRFSLDDRAFLRWADLVVLTSGVYVEDVFVYGSDYRSRKFTRSLGSY